jgi:hypothetical protein
MTASPLIITPSTGDPIEVQTTLQDTLAFEQFLRKNKRWGGLQDNALKLLPFKAFNAARRLDKLPEGVTTWEEFSEGPSAVLDVSVKDDDDDEELPEGSVEVEGLGEAGETGQSID